MLSERDKNILTEAGITVDQLARAAAAFLRAYPLHRVEVLSNALPAHEVAFLSAVGARGVDCGEPAAVTANIQIVAAEYAQMTATALSPREVAEKLGVSVRRVQQRIAAGTLYAVKGPSGRVCPAFQFYGDSTLPGLEVVLAAISREAHPIAVQRLFLMPSIDLESSDIGQALSPREWLISGCSPDPVTLLAQEL